MRMDRRDFLRGASAAAAVGAVARAVARDPARAASPVSALTIEELSPGLGLIRGAGGNVVVLDSPDGVLMVDGGSPDRAADVLELVKRRTGKPRVQVLFNTHWHWTHTGANRTLGPAGTRIIAHENTRLWLGTTVDCKWEHRVYPPLPPKARPSQSFYTTGTLAFGGEQIDYGYLPQAHTDGDIYVRFRHANVLVAGDVVSVGAYPVPDYCTAGWIGGTVAATEALIGLADADTRIVPGAGPIQRRADVEKEHAMLATVKQRLSELLAQGGSVQDMIAAAPTREFDAEWGDPRLFIANCWPGLVARAGELGVHIV
jgi:cyclase